MDLTWASSFDQFWRSPTFPMWLTLAAAAFLAVVFLVIVLRADRSIANGALAVMTLLAVAVAAAASVRGVGVAEEGGAASARAPFAAMGSLPALSCVDDLAGDSVEAACEKILFGSPDHVAAAVSYAAARLSRLTALGDAAATNKVMTPELAAMRRSIERDRYGLMAHVLTARDGCTAAICPAFQSLTDRKQIATHIEERVYDGLVERYSATWSSGGPSAATVSPAAGAAAAAAPAVAPTGKPTNAEFPTSASIPPVSIMTPEPSTGATAPAATATAPPTPSPRPAAAAKAQSTPHQPTQARRRPSPPPKSPASTPPAPPVQLAPANSGR